jgi:ABC-type multidrug transport system fused ATPase/permease subunit
MTTAKPKAKTDLEKLVEKCSVKGQKITPEPFKLIWSYMSKECCNVWLGLFFLTGSNLADFMTPVFVGWCVDAMIEERTNDLYWYILYLFIIVVYTAIMTGFRSQWFNSMSDRVEA